MKVIHVKKFIVVIILITFTGIDSIADEWKGWRGLMLQGSSQTDTGPLEWSSEKNVLWVADIEGEGYSSPVLSENEVIVTSALLSRTKVKLNTIIINLLLVIFIPLIMLNSFRLIRSLKLSENRLTGSTFCNLSMLIVYGLLTFAFCIMYWMYFNENRAESERILISYLFSGTVSLFCIFLIINKIRSDSYFRVVAGIIVLILSTLLILLHPFPELYYTSDFFKISNLWIFQLIIPCFILPVTLSLFIIIRTLLFRRILYKPADQNGVYLFFERLVIKYGYLPGICAFLIGITGLMSIPGIAFFKWINKDQMTRIQSRLELETFLSPEYAFPFFLGVIFIAFVLMFIIEFRRNSYEVNTGFRSSSVIFFCSLGFFIMISFVRQDPEYLREIICIDRFSGQLKWKKELLYGPPAISSNYNSQATPTPLIDSNRIYSYFGTTGLAATDIKGKVIWENKNLPFQCVHGAGASPVFSKNGVVILSSVAENPYLTSIDRETGEELWKTNLTPYTGFGGEYRSPLIFLHNNEEFIIQWSTARNELVLYDSGSGKAVNKFLTDWASAGESVVTPVLQNGVVYLADILNIAAVDLKKLIRNENPVLWITDLKGKGPATSSPVINSGLLFMVSDNGFVTGIDAATGLILWQEKLKGVYFSSIVSAGRQIYFSNTSGMTTILEADTIFRRISENNLPEGIYATPAPVDGYLYIRTKNRLWCIKGAKLQPEV